MVKVRVREMCGLGLTIEDVDVAEISVVCINIAKTKNNKSIICLAFDESCR